MTPSIMGFPLWRGKIKRRVAKKYIREIFNNKDFLSIFKNIKIGDLINDCSELNVRIKSLEPEYRVIRGGRILSDITIINHNGGSCSLVYCGVSAPKSLEEINKHISDSIPVWEAAGDKWGFAKRYKNIKIDEEGKAIYGT